MAEMLFGPDTSGEYDEPVASPLYDKLDELEDQALASARRYEKRRKRHLLLHWLLGLSVTGLAAVAGGGALTGRLTDQVVGGCAVAAAVLAALLTVGRPDRTATFEQTRQSVMGRLAVDAALARDGLEDVGHAEGVATVRRLYTALFDVSARSVSDGSPV
jgi:hypothetical protein